MYLPLRNMCLRREGKIERERMRQAQVRVTKAQSISSIRRNRCALGLIHVFKTSNEISPKSPYPRAVTPSLTFNILKATPRTQYSPRIFAESWRYFADRSRLHLYFTIRLSGRICSARLSQNDSFRPARARSSMCARQRFRRDVLLNICHSPARFTICRVPVASGNRKFFAARVFTVIKVSRADKTGEREGPPLVIRARKLHA